MVSRVTVHTELDVGLHHGAITREVLAGYQPQTEDGHSGLEKRNCISSSETDAPPPNGNKSFLFRKRRRIELSVCWLKYVCLGEKILEEFNK